MSDDNVRPLFAVIDGGKEEDQFNPAETVFRKSAEFAKENGVVGIAIIFTKDGQVRVMANRKVPEVTHLGLLESAKLIIGAQALQRAVKG